MKSQIEKELEANISNRYSINDESEAVSLMDFYNANESDMTYAEILCVIRMKIGEVRYFGMGEIKRVENEMPDEVETLELTAFEEHEQDMENDFRLNHC